MENKENNKIAVVLGITDNWVFAAATVLLGIKKHTREKNFDVIIFNQNLDDKNKRLLNKIFKCKFIKFDESKIKSERFEKITKMAFMKYEVFELTKRYNRVIYLDSDIVIKGDINELFETNFTQEIAMHNRNVPLKKDFEKSSLDTKYDMETGCFNVGVMICTNKIEKSSEIKDWCYKMTNEYADYMHGDQAIINLALQEFHLKVYPLEEKYNCLPRRSNDRIVKDVRIVHPRGDKCFWKNIIDLQWDKYYEQWKRMGGNGPELPYFIKRNVKYLLNWISPDLEYYIRMIWRKKLNF